MSLPPVPLTLRVWWERARVIAAEAAKFGVVGLVALVVDVGLFNLLRYAGDPGAFYEKPLTAKAISVVAATIVAYLGNRLWAFKDREAMAVGRGFALFVVLNAVAMGIALLCLWFTHYGLGFDSAIADNISANVIGLGLGTLFRFWSYRKWVFPAADPAEIAAESVV